MLFQVLPDSFINHCGHGFFHVNAMMFQFSYQGFRPINRTTNFLFIILFFSLFLWHAGKISQGGRRVYILKIQYLTDCLVSYIYDLLISNCFHETLGNEAIPPPLASGRVQAERHGR